MRRECIKVLGLSEKVYFVDIYISCDTKYGGKVKSS
jgi:hypothetical protein